MGSLKLELENMTKVGLEAGDGMRGAWSMWGSRDGGGRRKEVEINETRTDAGNIVTTVPSTEYHPSLEAQGNLEFTKPRMINIRDKPDNCWYRYSFKTTY